MAEPPIFADEFASSSFGEAIFGGSYVFGGRNDAIGTKELVVGPVSRKSNLFFDVSLKTFNHTQDFFHIATELLRIVENAANFAFWINDEDGADGVGVVVLSWVDKAKSISNSAGIGNDRELDFGIKMLFDPFGPFDMRENLVNAEAK